MDADLKGRGVPNGYPPTSHFVSLERPTSPSSPLIFQRVASGQVIAQVLTQLEQSVGWPGAWLSQDMAQTWQARVNEAMTCHAGDIMATDYSQVGHGTREIGST